MFYNEVKTVATSVVELVKVPVDKAGSVHTLYLYNTSETPDTFDLELYDASEATSTSFLTKELDGNTEYAFPKTINMEEGDEIRASSTNGNIVALVSLFISADAGSANYFVIRGEYDPAATYDTLHVVNYNGSSFVSTVDGLTGVEPDLNEDDGWELLAAQGSGTDADTLNGVQLADITWSDVSMATTDVSAADVELGDVPNEDATDMANWDQKSANSGQAPVWDGSQWTPQSVEVDLLDVSDDGSTVVSDVVDINFNSNLSVTDDGDGSVTVNVSGLGTQATKNQYIAATSQNNLDGDVTYIV